MKRKTLLMLIGMGTLLLSWAGNVPAQMPDFQEARDGSLYPYVVIGPLDWFTENLRCTTVLSLQVEDSALEKRQACGEFYPVEEADTACSIGWRLPTEAGNRRMN